MDSYLQSYGEGDERRNRIIKWSITGVVAVLLLSWFSYLFFHDYFETRAVKHFLEQVNSKQYRDAYRAWGCTENTPCPNYDFSRFMDDWGPKSKAASPWHVDSVEGCRMFVTVNVAAQGAETQSLGVERGTKTVMYAPSAECQERQWRFKAFFRRILGHG